MSRPSAEFPRSARLVEALLDSEGTLLDSDRNPASMDTARASVERVRGKYL